MKKAIRKELRGAKRRRSLRKWLYRWPAIAALGYIGFVLLAFSKAQSALEAEIVAGFVLLYAAIRFRFALAFRETVENLLTIVLSKIDPASHQPKQLQRASIKASPVAMNAVTRHSESAFWQTSGPSQVMDIRRLK